jgi:hypothetical protein
MHDSWEMSLEEAEQVDAVLKFYEATQMIRVDRDRLHESMEAWVHVRVEEHPNVNYRGFGPTSGVITWLNSD